MKKAIALLAMFVLVGGAVAQTLNIQTGNVTYAVPAAQAGEMIYAEGTTLTVLGKTFGLDAITRMYVDDSDVSDNTVTVLYDGATATVTVAGNIARYVDPTISGGHVSILQSEDVSDNTCGEITYSVSGSSADGEFTLEGSYKATIELRGLTLTNPYGAPLNIQNGKRIELSVKNGTVNTLVDGLGGTQKGCLVCKGHLELKGKGTLNVYGNTAHAIYAKEYIEMKNCTVNVLSAVKDGLNCNQYFMLESGELNIAGIGDDGLQVSFKDDVDREPEDSGSITVAGGVITATVTATAAKGLKADGDIIISGGTLDIVTSGGGKWDAEDLKTKAAACISASGNVSVENGTLVLTSLGSGGKGISCDGDLSVSGGTMTVSTSGGMYAYVNGVEYSDYTGNADNLDSDQKSSPKGLKSDGDVTINGGNIKITTTGTGGEGIESKAVLTVNDGTIVVNSYDDCLNSSGHMFLNGGDITVVSTNNDGIDSNGNMYISGGVIRAFGTSAPECGIDANEEEGYTVIFTGGTLLAVGGGNSVPSTSESTQAYVCGSGQVVAGSTITLGNGSETFATFTVPDEYVQSGSSAPGFGGPGGPGGPGGSGSQSCNILVSCADLVSGSSYTLTNGSSTISVTAVLQGSSGSRPGGW